MKHKLLALLVVWLLAIPLSAKAHDQLVDQSPADGAVLDAGVIELELTFNNDLLALEGGAGNEIVVQDPSGEIFYTGCLPVSGQSGMLSLDLDQPGNYQVAWRVVSSDGHPIAGDFGFEIVNDGGYVANPNFGYPDCKGEVSIEIEDENPQFLYWVLWLSMGAVAAVLFLFLRPKKNVEPAEGGQY